MLYKLVLHCKPPTYDISNAYTGENLIGGACMISTVVELFWISIPRQMGHKIISIEASKLYEYRFSL